MRYGTALLLWIFLLTTVSAAPVSPRGVIMERSEQLITALQENVKEINHDPALARRLAEEIILPLVDFPRIARRVLGRHWSDATREQREDFNREFRNFLAHVFVAAMMNYARDIITYAKDVLYPPIPWLPADSQATVRMRVKLKGGLKAMVGYRMHLGGGDWKIHDVTIAGISFASTYRSSFHSEIVKHGLDGLIGRLVERNRKNAISTGHR